MRGVDLTGAAEWSPCPTSAAPCARRVPNTMSEADYARATTERNIAARARGLNAPYIPGGEDPNLEATIVQERRLTRWLVGMVLVIVIGGFLISITGLILMSNR